MNASKLITITIDVDECQSTPCGANEECINIIGGHICPCKNGYAPNEFEVCTG